ncbi:serine hydrolase [Propionicimonas sp.]|uniref:serine hydrolase n=1 Tax=Propionicimonas sp. TaxID=1955623 RepID=UPI00180A3F1D|nr:serine hydrolase [Propionicimonas sp.]MBU3975582.1 class A beta-lactamase-related serine hydrolase [Actinomycetota bacterium]MBA3020014.1 serine hydrolase [Propionicimonas sp.]MBU3986269.1 class A beta-lactamase-related serine hydrolase [Actinomycetota bacterium]MBU4007838.1 class A beta-lactamase-related serine hydrolase [Actinomycetota bacterium]MBU4064096.1 class A beta-lactamase-related serine hydrolase [Actinomycetota bacterium]
MAGTLADTLRPCWDAELARLPGTFSAVLSGLDGPLVARDAHASHYAASTIKVAVLAALLAARARGERGALGAALVHARFPSRTGGRFELSQGDDQDDATWARLGERVELLKLAEAMITVSSNIATDLIAERIGLATVADFLTRADLATELSMERLIGDADAEASGLTNTVTAAGLAALFAGLANDAWLSADDSEVAVSMLARQTHLDGLPAGLPPRVWSASKGGWVPGVRHDVALVRPAKAPPYVLAVCTTSGVAGDAVLALLGRLSAITYQEWTRWHA